MKNKHKAARRSGFRAPQAILALASVFLMVAWFVPLRPAGLTVNYTTEGTVVRTADGGTRSLSEGETVGPGDRVVVPTGGSLTLTSPDGHNISLVDSTELSIDVARETYLGDKVQTQLGVDEGSVRISGTGRERSSLDIGLPNGLAGVRGTDFGIQITGTQTLISVHEGSIEVEDATGAVVDLGAGQGVVLSADGASVSVLPAAPTILSPTGGTTVASLGTQLSWTAVAEATGYVVEIALDTGFLQVLERTTTNDQAIDVPILSEDQPVFVRVSAMTVDGLVGAPSDALSLDIRLRLAQGLELQAGGDLLGSVAEFEAAISNYPDDVGLLRDLAWALYLSDRYAEARPYYESAVVIEPEDMATRLELARVYFWVEEYDLAQEVYGAILGADENDPDALWGLGDVYRVTGNTSEAIRLVERALALDPDHPYAAETLRQLRNQG